MLAFFDDCRRLVDEDEVSELVTALATKAGGTQEKHEVARIAAGALVNRRPNRSRRPRAFSRER